MSFLLDRFPIEILHMIFDYFWAHEILHSFFDTSDYIDNILSNYDRYRINGQSITKSDFDFICHFILPNQVISLILSDENETPYQSELFFSDFQISYYNRLRTLKLIDLNDDGEEIFMNLHHVQSLVSLEINIRIDLPFIQQLPSLKKLIINIPSNIQFDILPSISTVSFKYLQYFSLSYCTLTALQHFFRQMSQLKSFKTSLLFFTPEELNVLSHIHQIQSTPVNLISFSLSINAPFEDRLLNANRWEKFIIEYLPKLKNFNFKFFSRNINYKVLNRYRSSFWLNKHWYVAFDLNLLLLFTVPYFAPTSMNDSSEPISSNCTTLPIEQHYIFYDRITALTYELDKWNLSYRYNNINELTFNNPYMYENIGNLSKVKSFIVNTSDWLLDKIIILIKEEMPSVNYLRLNCIQSNIKYKFFSRISLPQIRTLALPQYGRCREKIKFYWWKLFPCVERLIVSINSKKQIPFLIDHFTKMISGFFVIHNDYFNMYDRIKITSQWLKQNTCRLKRKNEDEFVCQIIDQFGFSLALWIS
ncbi:unnamed protein product [Rotaria sordida]|uniref:F-box domain-containing protein n=2 Tax=Rotaria sordida TaxID=392033 RepID=A0A814UTW3_9BILA|nr:unnamed protein product [Rotaria sordida]CAF1436786.1 unnamed protein product [Rotaria sordida]